MSPPRHCGRKEKAQRLASSALCSVQALNRLVDANSHWVWQPTLLSPPVQMLNPPRNTLKDILRNSEGSSGYHNINHHSTSCREGSPGFWGGKSDESRSRGERAECGFVCPEGRSALRTKPRPLPGLRYTRETVRHPASPSKHGLPFYHVAFYHIAFQVRKETEVRGLECVWIFNPEWLTSHQILLDLNGIGWISLLDKTNWK